MHLNLQQVFQNYYGFGLKDYAFLIRLILACFNNLADITQATEYFDNPANRVQAIEYSNSCFKSLVVRDKRFRPFDCYLRMFKKVSFVKVMGLVENTTQTIA